MTNLPASDSEIIPRVRPIRSFVRREGRMTESQKKALEFLWRRYGLTLEVEQLDFDSVFNRQAQRVLEIGFGNGESLITQAQANPAIDFIGIEVYRPGIGHLLLRLENQQIENVRIIDGDAMEILQRYFPDQALDGVHIFFPDPWPKKRHHKRRLVQPSLVELLWHKIKVGGWLHLATDWQDYAEHMLAVLSQHPGFQRLTGMNQTGQHPIPRPPTKFEQRGQRQGHQIRDLEFSRSS